ncbi:class I SAM-dependent methyltransferase [Psychroflexus gondwanensis]|uniref:class I SAM-dependent methyltransferase n=1 Tax=Psychroflexus gondwanensis TaxID=251 RepID=UPI0011BDA0CF|nr:class I SAM-dependent methyltransferase [Psychroflexus gondwanensis]TXE17920.1 class I SAM-dependent methyltransferase [Psychroflexus gondwanensis]
MNPNSISKDIFGLAVESYYKRQDQTPIIVHAEDFYDDKIPVEYLFRTYEEMPEIEQKAIQLSTGTTLDVGCCAGSHSLELKKRGLDVLPIDISKKCIGICKERGLPEAMQTDFFILKDKTFDTILLLMNGIGIAQTIKNLPVFFNQIKTLLKPDGQVLLDSSDLIFLHENEIMDDSKYYGEITYSTSYKNKTSRPFPWLYLDFELLKDLSEKEGFTCELIYSDDHYGFLAKLKLN